VYVLFLTLEIPRLNFVQIDVFYDVEVDLVRRHLLPQVVVDEFLVGGVETESRGHMGESVHPIPLIPVTTARGLHNKRFSTRFHHQQFKMPLPCS
jgi:hypothetical protein